MIDEHMSDDERDAAREVSTLATMHECASCHAFIFNAKKFEGHEPTCMQPEIRMRRLEARVARLEEQVEFDHSLETL